ncbi:endonuclease III; DNA-(apurinic or apyrimidinic site) lyase [Corynebacterium mustelae]|uniref:Endonuclease III n=1 Tax=Corynebacterium mustelae TaxID=571915 RepID=A0A0G3H5X9_9CORY|nr:endonuclease III [Corynebacterium mustelae]AKK07238.1 endonuclease III; DNA-(apurinic or apyrimidinic site) lyase [Corynebacterium mustelae]
MTQPQCKTQNRATTLNQELARGYPNARCELNYDNPLQLLIATILSAQSTDTRVNQVTPTLFAEYPTAQALAAATPEHLQAIIRPTGLHSTKTKQLIQLGQQLVKQHNGTVPDTRDQLTKLPGVGRKTANVVLGNAYGQPALSVDTHFARIVKRFELTEEDTPEKIEKDISSLLGKSEWTIFSHRVIFHGRRLCHSRNPACGVCFLAKMCPSYGIGETDPVRAQNRIKTDTAERQHLLQLASL